jgi:hypothetical protein
MSNLALVLAFFSTLALFSTTARAGEPLDDGGSTHPCADEYASALHGDVEAVQEAFGCWQREVDDEGPLALRNGADTTVFQTDLRSWSEARAPVFEAWTRPSAGVWPLGAAPSRPGTTTVAISGLATSALSQGNYANNIYALTTTTITHVASPRVSVSAVAYGNVSANPDVRAMALGRVLLTKPTKPLRFALIGGAAVGTVGVSPAAAVSFEADVEGAVFDASVGFPIWTEGGLSLFDANRHHVVRMGWTLTMPTIGYRYATERHFAGVELAALPQDQAIWFRAGYRLGRL